MDQSVDVPLSALKKSTLFTLAAGLNQHKIIPSDEGLPRDWRGLAQLMGLNGIEIKQISSMPDSFSALIEYWGPKGNIRLLQQYLGVIDRYDVLDDTREAMVKDSLEYNERLKNINSRDDTSVSIEADRNILTVDDLIRLEKGLEPQIYDAYILYAEEDTDFAAQIIETMESKYNFKFCVRDRDLIGGVKFEHDAITKLIAERCRRLVVIVSSNFLKSKANKFFLTFAQALGIDIRERKVIPILYERCEVPPELSYYFLLDYNRAGKLWNFWDKLRDSIQAPEASQANAIKDTDNCVKSKSANYLWISRTHFEEGHMEPAVSQSDLSVSKMKNKPNIYKIVKNRFKVKKNLNSRSTEENVSDIDYETSMINQLENLVSNDEVQFNNFDSSTGSENKDDYSRDGNKKAKRKWYKKRIIDSFVS